MPEAAIECDHEHVERIARFYMDGKPLYRCLDCHARLTYEDDTPSFKALAPLIVGKPEQARKPGNDTAALHD